MAERKHRHLMAKPTRRRSPPLLSPRHFLLFLRFLFFFSFSSCLFLFRFVYSFLLSFLTASLFTQLSPMVLRFEVLGRFNRARAARLTLPHFVCQTPLFMPVGTQAMP